MINTEILETKIGELLGNFYARRIQALESLELHKTLKRKNPYLYRATGTVDASEIVEELLRAHISSSDETLFGNEFFEPLAKWVAKAAHPDYNVAIAHGEGIDITIETDSIIMGIAVKSGTNVFNAQSKRKQALDFQALRRRLQKATQRFDPIVTYCYGRKQQRTNSTSPFQEVAGQATWELLTGESDFYLRIVRLMKDKPAEHRPIFQEEFDKAKNRFARDLLLDFSTQDGSIDWDKLAHYNSGKEPPPRRRSTTKKALD